LKGDHVRLQLVVFANAAAMHAVSLEGLIAYRADVKQLFFRDHITWRSLRVRRRRGALLLLFRSCHSRVMA